MTGLAALVVALGTACTPAKSGGDRWTAAADQDTGSVWSGMPLDIRTTHTTDGATVVAFPGSFDTVYVSQDGVFSDDDGLSLTIEGARMTGTVADNSVSFAARRTGTLPAQDPDALEGDWLVVDTSTQQHHIWIAELRTNGEAATWTDSFGATVGTLDGSTYTAQDGANWNVALDFSAGTGVLDVPFGHAEVTLSRLDAPGMLP